MEVYRVYKEGPRGYESVCVLSDIDDLFTILDILIKEEECQKVLVIENTDGYEFPMYLYTGNINDYEVFKLAHKDMLML